MNTLPFIALNIGQICPDIKRKTGQIFSRRLSEALSGATGYLLKDSDSTEIVAAIRAISRGESLIHPSVASKILAEFSLLAEGKVSRNPSSHLSIHSEAFFCCLACDAVPVGATILHGKRRA